MPDWPWSQGDEGPARLLEAARLATLGRLVPAVAHQLATPLASIALRAESLEGDLHGPGGAVPGDKLERYLRAISAETLRCKELLANLRVFARAPDPAFGKVDVNALCRGAAALVLHEGMRRQVEVQLDLDEALPVVRGCEGRLGQAVLSLLVNGLDASGFGSPNWIVFGHQQKFEQVQATDLAVVGRLDYVGSEGVMVGVSGYYGNSTDNRPKPDMEGIDGHVTIGDVHAVVERGPFIARGEYLYGTIENADIISQRNAQLPQTLQAPRTPVGSAAMLWYAEAGYDVLSFLRPGSTLRLFPFARFEYYNSMEKVDAGVFANPRFERHVTTGGINLFITPNVVFKADYSHRTFGDDDLNGENTVSVALGFSGTFFEHKN